MCEEAMAETTEQPWPLVTLDDGGIRPAGPSDACFYCSQRVGQEHKRDCVMVQKRVKLRYTFEVDVDVPHHWTPATVESHRNESTWCADNAVPEIEAQGDAHGCLCPVFQCVFVEVLDWTPRVETKTPEQVAQSDATRRLLVQRAPDPTSN